MRARHLIRLGRLSVAVALVGSAFVGQPAQAAVRKAVFPQSTAAKIGLLAPDWQAPTRSDAAWDDAARNFDILVGQREQYATRLARLHTVNPKVTLLWYNNGPYLKKNSTQFNNTMSAHPEYFARDMNGNLITAKLFPDNYLMDQGLAGYRTQAAEAIADVLQNYPDFDGVSVDSMGNAALNTAYVSSLPKNTATGSVYTVSEWLAASVQSLNTIKTTVKTRLGGVDRYVMVNGLKDGPTYAASAKVLATSKADGGIAESFLRLAESPPTKYPTASAWLQNLKMITAMQAKNKGIFVWTKLWTTSTPTQQTDWNRFALATFLLGAGAKAYYDFLPTTTSDRTAIFDANWRSALGAPSGPYTVANGVYSRKFARGSVSVNPTTRAATITVTP